jgi:hypothetical protein
VEKNMRFTDKQVTTMIIFTTILWAFLLIAVWVNNDTLVFIGFLSSILLLLAYLLLGSVQHDRIKAPIFLFAIMTSSALLWLVAFISLYLTKGKVSDTLFMGFYSGQFLVLLCGWIGILFLLSIGYAKYFDQLISEERWRSFIKRLEELKKKAH